MLLGLLPLPPAKKLKEESRKSEGEAANRESKSKRKERKKRREGDTKFIPTRKKFVLLVKESKFIWCPCLSHGPPVHYRPFFSQKKKPSLLYYVKFKKREVMLCCMEQCGKQAVREEGVRGRALAFSGQKEEEEEEGGEGGCGGEALWEMRLSSLSRMGRGEGGGTTSGNLITGPLQKQRRRRRRRRRRWPPAWPASV